MTEMNNDAGMPIVLTLDPGVYYRCPCGKSESLPFCDGHHQGGEPLPVQFEIRERERVYLCSCGKSEKQPYCDGHCGVKLQHSISQLQDFSANQYFNQ